MRVLHGENAPIPLAGQLGASTHPKKANGYSARPLTCQVRLKQFLTERRI